jgi:hypothetical protein
MKRFALGLLLNVVMVFTIFGGLSETVQAKVIEPEESNEVVISGGGGIFYPFKGRSGVSGVIQAMGFLSPQERVGVEMEYRKYETNLFKAKDIDTQSYILRGIGQYYFRSHGITPYIGLGVNIALNVYDESEIEKKRPSINVKGDKGIGSGIMGLVGLEVPMGQHVALFAEGRVSADIQFTRYKNESGKNKFDVESLSGLTGLGGIRIRF